MPNKNITIDSLDKPNPLPNQKQTVIRHNPLTEPWFVALVLVLTLLFLGVMYFIFQQLDYQSMFAVDTSTRVLATIGKWTIIAAPIILLGYIVFGVGTILVNAAKKVGLASFSEYQTSIEHIKRQDARNQYYAVAMEDAKQSQLRNVTNYSPTSSSTNNSTTNPVDDNDIDLTVIPWDKFI